MRRIKRKQKDRWVFSAVDFADIGDRRAVGRALARLAISGVIARLCPGFYHSFIFLKLTNRPAPANHYNFLAAYTRRYGLKIVPHDLYFANGLGLTNAVLAKNIYQYVGRTQVVAVGEARITLQHASPSFMRHATASYGPGFQALTWLGRDICAAERDFILKRLPPALLADMRKHLADLPVWMQDILR